MSKDNKPAHWEDDKLERYKQAVLIKDFLSAQYESGFRNEEGAKSFVLNLDAEWGYGKTFFLNRFAKDLEEDHLVLRYNAWANDYAKDPLLSFLSQITRELAQQLDQHGRTAESNVKRRGELFDNAIRMIKASGKAAAPKLITAGLTTLFLGIPLPTGSSEDREETGGPGEHEFISSEEKETITRTIGASVEAAMNTASSDLFSEENSRQSAVKAFQESLGDIVKTLTEQEGSGCQSSSNLPPIFVIIDELDRCRPNFTVELIECVKHLFSVDGLYFIFATDGQQLQAAINGLYGPSFDAEIYFNRIFNKEIGLNIPDQRALSEALIKEYGLSDAVSNYNLLPYSLDSIERENVTLQEDFRIVSDFFGLDLRSQKQVLSAFHTLTLARHRKGLRTHTIPALSLIVIWQRKKDFFRRLKNTPVVFKSAQEFEQDLRSISGGGDYHLPLYVIGTDHSNPHHSSRIKRSIPEILHSFINMYSHDPVVYLERQMEQKAGRTGTEALFIQEYKREVKRAGGDAIRRNPLRDYFEQITMVS